MSQAGFRRYLVKEMKPMIMKGVPSDDAGKSQVTERWTLYELELFLQFQQIRRPCSSDHTHMEEHTV